MMNRARSAALPLRLIILASTMLAAGALFAVAPAEAAQFSSGGLTTSASASPASGAPGTTFAITALVRSDTARSVLVDVEVYDANWTRVGQQFFDAQAFTAGQQRSFNVSWPSSAAAPGGTYTVMVGIFSPGWTTLLHWNGSAASIALSSSTPSGQSVTATSSASPASVGVGGTVSITATVRSTTARQVLVVTDVFDRNGTRVHRRSWDNRSLLANMPRNFSTSWIPTASAVAGDYMVRISVSQAGGATLLTSNDSPARFTVVGPAPTPTASPAPTPAPSPTPSPAPTGRFVTLPPGSALPSGAECAARVRRSTWEPRPQNFTANHTVPAPQSTSIGGASASFNAAFAGRIDGNFTGTTDELIQWASCKWGFDEDLTRARVIAESFWTQSAEGDITSNAATCAQIGKSAPCGESYGLLQVRFTAHPGTYPRAAVSSPYNLDYTLANTRACYEGDMTWLNTVERVGTYAAGDLWGCVGTWFSGRWYVNSQAYISTVQGHLAAKPWLQTGF